MLSKSFSGSSGPIGGGSLRRLAVAGGAGGLPVLADDLVLLACLDAQIAAAEAKLAQLLPDPPSAPLTRMPGWGMVRAANHGAAVGDLDRWPGARQLYRASGLTPARYESAGKRRDGGISREGSVRPRWALIDLGIGLWRADQAARRYGQRLRAHGMKRGVSGCAMANRANKIAYALVLDQCVTIPAAGPDRTAGFLDRCSICRAHQRSTWSARSELIPARDQR